MVIVTARERIRATFRSVVNVERKPIHCQLEIQTKYTFGFHNRLKLNRIALGHHLRRIRLDIYKNTPPTKIKEAQKIK